MVDLEKTNELRNKLNPLKTNVEDNKSTKDFLFLFIFLLKIFFFHLSQDVVLTKFNIPSMLWWESAIVYLGVISFVSIFKKS